MSSGEKPAKQNFKSKLKSFSLQCKLEIPTKNDDIDDSSFKVRNGTFKSGDISITSSGMNSADMELKAENEARKYRLEDLELLHVLGRGNSGVVHKAKHRKTGQFIALKIINILNRDERHQLMKELHTLDTSDCPYLVEFYEAFYADPSISIALEYMDVGSLQDVLQRVKVIPEEIVQVLARHITEGLLYLHKKYVLHRDVKSSNVCVSSSGFAKLMDFGISEQLQDSMAQCETFVGTYTHMSPERIQGQGYSYSSDIWSLGILLLECTSGEYPYPLTGVVIDLMNSIVSGPPTIPTSVSDEYKSFLNLCLQSDVNKRATAEDLLNHPFIADLDAEEGSQRLSKWVLANSLILEQKGQTTSAADQLRERLSRFGI